MDVQDRIPTNMRMLLLLEALVARQGGASPADLAREVGLPKATVHRLCMALIEAGFLARDRPDGTVRAGRRARELASGLLYAGASHVERRLVLEGLAEEIGETINFVVPSEGGMSYRDRVETRWPFRIQLPVGTTVPFHCTASGKAYLATLGRAELKRMVEVMPLARHTDNTLTDQQAFLDDLKATARRGYALDDEEFYDGMVAVAVPVRSATGRYLASLAFHGPTPRVTIDSAASRAPRLMEAAERLAKILV